MKLAQIMLNGHLTLCAAAPEGLIDLAPQGYRCLMDAITRPEGLPDALAAATQTARPIPPTKAVFAPAADANARVICVGVNYKKHIEECGEQLPVRPVIFSKFSSALAAHNEVIHPPRVTCKLDYEAELVIIIGQCGRSIPEEQALSHVFGYTCGNDLSARDLQMATSQWLVGKTCDQFAPVGPYVVTADAIDPHHLSIQSRLNGELRQNANTDDMIFPIERIVSYLSTIMALRPGDIVFTGTPNGVILGMPEGQQRWMQPGDLIEITIEGIGTLANTVGDAV